MALSWNLLRLHVLLAGLVFIICISQASGDYDCCTSYTQKKIPQKIIKGFYIQRSSEVCDIDAIVFEVAYKSPGNRNVLKSKLCADPKQKWVESRIEELKNKALKMKIQKKARKWKRIKKQNKIWI
ncbi:hypothetical protein XENTR_v10014893 [Xenopus tropicalis]|uniref:C-C motif chemokine 20 n=1 Tax=Xenopus tropicalis TaxID=8364 RepID=A0A8J0QVR6_XENTR|eukprot:XP_002939967.1 PREDICTED: C-C motif chemokine 20-like [Xenopus tropicalis]